MKNIVYTKDINGENLGVQEVLMVSDNELKTRKNSVVKKEYQENDVLIFKNGLKIFF